jgi:hypothetical protein
VAGVSAAGLAWHQLKVSKLLTRFFAHKLKLEAKTSTMAKKNNASLAFTQVILYEDTQTTLLPRLVVNWQLLAALLVRYLILNPNHGPMPIFENIRKKGRPWRSVVPVAVELDHYKASHS